MYVSPELQIDETLKKILLKKRYEKHFTGVDVSDDAFDEWRQSNDGGGTAEDWWEQVILPALSDLPPGTFIVLDDAPDSPIHRMIRPWLIKMLRTANAIRT